MSNTKVQVIHQNNELSGFGDYVPMEDGDRVIVTLPDGTVDKFTFEAVPGTSLGGAAISYEPSFVPNAGTTDQLLVSTGENTELQAVGNGLETEYVNLETGDSYNPALPEFGGAYILQLHNGTQLTIDASTGDLSSINDLNNNQLTFTGTGIESSSGSYVQFSYASNGRHHVDHQLHRPDGELPVRRQRQPGCLHRRRRQHDAVHVLERSAALPEPNHRSQRATWPRPPPTRPWPGEQPH